MPTRITSTLLNIYRTMRYHFHHMTFSPHTIRTQVGDISFDFYIADPVAREWYEGGYGWPELAFWRNRLTDAVVLDCGGHHGFTATYFGKCVGDNGKVIVFEPHPFNASVIRKNIQLNNLKNVSVENKAVGNIDGTTYISFSSDASVQQGSLATISVPVTMIDNYAYLKPTMLKLDVEGFEVLALKGARKVLSTHPALELEIHTKQLPQYGCSVEDVLSLLELAAYDCWILGPTGFQPYEHRIRMSTNFHLLAIPK